MTAQEQKWFEELAKDREESARVFMKASNRGVWTAIVDKYSDQAHFIYELLQNADDAGANRAEFRLERDRLLFKHNGTRRFSITNPATEGADFERGKVGDLNSITGAGGFSTKRNAQDEGNAIGKFGVGFKAVFQYTTRPEVYDDNMAFRLQDYIVPHPLSSDDEWRTSGETLFIFPLNKPEVRDARGDIWKKLNTLIFPTLFLNNLKSVKFSDGITEGSYAVKEDIPRENGDGFFVRKISAKSNTTDGSRYVQLWMFEQTDERNNKYSVGYAVDETGKLKPVDYKAFCYFPTKHDTKLNFIIHAPFLLTDSREGIKSNEDHNETLISELAGLATRGLEYLCERSKTTNERIVTDDVIKVIPVTFEDYGDGISFDAFRREFKNLFNCSCVIPASDAYVDYEHAYWAESLALPQHFSDSDLCVLSEEKGVKWAFPTIPKEHRSIKHGYDSVFDFIGNCTVRHVSDNEIIKSLTADFVEKKPFPWLEELYKWISENTERIKAARQSPIFLDQEGKACPAFSKDGKKILYLPLAGETRYNFVNVRILANAAAKKIIKEYELEEPSKDDYIQLLIDQKISTATGEESDEYFKIIFEYYVAHPIEVRRAIAQGLKGRIRLLCTDSLSGERLYCAQEWFYSPEKELQTYFEGYAEPSDIPIMVGDHVFLTSGTFKGLSGDVTDIDDDNRQLTVEVSIFSKKISVNVGVDDIVMPTLAPRETRKRRFKDYGVKFLDLEHYKTITSSKHSEDLQHLLSDIGLCTYPVLRSKEYGYEYRYGEGNAISFTHGAEKKSYLDKFIIRRMEGSAECLNRIVASKDIDAKRILSTMLWKFLCLCAARNEAPSVCRMADKFNLSFLSSLHRYEYYGQNDEGFDDPQLTRLCEEKWIVIDEWTVKAPCEVALSEMPLCYVRIEGVRAVMDALGIVEFSKSDAEYQAKMEARKALSDEDQNKLEFAEAINTQGYTKEQINEILAQYKANERKRPIEERNEIGSDSPEVDDQQRIESNPASGELTNPERESSDEAHVRKKAVRPNSVLAAIEEHLEEIKNPNFHVIKPLPSIDDEDEDEITPRKIDFDKRIKNRELKQAGEIASLEKGRELQEEAHKLPRYTLGWFKAMLGLEMLGMEDDAASQHEISIAFTKVELERGSEHTYVFKRPSRNIPQWMEELSDVPMDMLVGNRTLRPRVEAMSVKSFDLRVKFKDDEILKDIDLSELKEARMSVQRPDFLLTSLRDGLNLLPYDDSKNLCGDLNQNIEFIFGPPGTGKTTFLANERILNLMHRGKGMKVLVLAPTNKAADVLAYRIVTNMPQGESCQSWLVRFGSTNDERLEKSGVKCGKDINVATMERCCLVTTIARFPYDKYVPGNAEPIRLEEVEWDYIIIDEASMIPLVNIAYVLYRRDRAKFIIAGDPFQIDPIVRNDEWSEENIYTMVGLDDFAHPTTRPHEFPVVKLTKQYRSVPCIGRLFSRYRYAGILEHARTETGELRIGGLGTLKPLTIVKFPVSDYESVYSPKRLRSGMNGGSPYQIYSALFTFEFVCAVARKRADKNSSFRIGVISPYKAQADLVQRLVESVNLPESVEISASTVHGFQGDECDMVVALFNPPPGLAGGNRAFVNKKNIINVAISRARDYLVLVMPDDETPKIENMLEVRKIEHEMLNSNPAATIIGSWTLEKWMFGSESYIEDNSFSSGHQSVNVYGLPERRYEVRSEDSAVDIQIHDIPKPVARTADVQSRIQQDFLDFLKVRVNHNVAKSKAIEYRTVYYRYREVKKAGNDVKIAVAYQELRNAASFFYGYYGSYVKSARNPPRFNEVMRRIVDRLNNIGSIW